ncbi:hypothetical protein BH23PLA1_BH23PLA1_34930 [soil metagenome]
MKNEARSAAIALHVASRDQVYRQLGEAADMLQKLYQIHWITNH